MKNKALYLLAIFILPFSSISLAQTVDTELDSVLAQRIEPLAAANIELFMNLNGTDGATTTTDESQYAHPITFVGDAQLDTAIKRFGSAAYLSDGTGDELVVTPLSDFDLGTDDFTIEFWIYRNGTQGGETGIISAADATGDGYNITFAGSSSNKIRWSSNGDGSWTWSDLESSTALPDQAWTHIAFVRDGNTLMMWQDGVDVGTFNTTGYDYDVGGLGSGLKIGSTWTNQVAVTPLTGSIDSIKITKGVAIYTSAFTPPQTQPEATGSTKNTLYGWVGAGTDPSNTLSVAGEVAIGDTYASIAAPTNGLIVEGNVGIGSSSPTEALDVAGNIDASGAITAVGKLSSSNLATDSTTLYVGEGTGGSNSSTLVGGEAGASTTVNNIVAVGYQAGKSTTLQGHNGTYVGYQAGINNSKWRGTFIGHEAGDTNTGEDVTFVGYQSGINNTGNYSIAIGQNAGDGNSGDRLAAIGVYAGHDNSGNNNTCTGALSCSNSAGDRLSVLGYEAGVNVDSDDNVIIGYNAAESYGISNTLIIQQRNVNEVPLIGGKFDSGNVGIGITLPLAHLHVGTGGTPDEMDGLGDAYVQDELEVDGTIHANGLLIVDKVTSDPCSSGAPEAGIFWNDTSNYLCVCDGTNDVQVSDGTSACF